MFSIRALLLAAANLTIVSAAARCNKDNCLNNLSNNPTSASQFCVNNDVRPLTTTLYHVFTTGTVKKRDVEALTTPTLMPTSTLHRAGLVRRASTTPFSVAASSKCGNNPTRISSACSCFAGLYNSQGGENYVYQTVAGGPQCDAAHYYGAIDENLSYFDNDNNPQIQFQNTNILGKGPDGCCLACATKPGCIGFIVEAAGGSPGTVAGQCYLYVQTAGFIVSQRDSLCPYGTRAVAEYATTATARAYAFPGAGPGPCAAATKFRYG